MPQLYRSRVANHAPTRGKETDVFIALLPIGERRAPTDQQLIVSTGGAAKGATSIPLTGALTGDIEEDQYLCFADANGKEYLALLSSKADGTDTPVSALPVVALGEAIPAGAVAEFPPYLWDRTAADVDRSYSLNSVTTFNTGDSRDGVITGNEKNITLPGLYFFYNAAYKTAKLAADSGRELWVTRLIRKPNDNYQSGDKTEGAAVVTAAPSPSSQDGQVGADLTLAFVGPNTESDAIPTS